MAHTVHLTRLDMEHAAPAARMVLDDTRKSLGFIPNLYAAMANNPALLRAYTQGYQALREHSGLTPIELEIVFLAISRENGCDYCVSAHSFIADRVSKVPADVTAAVRDRRPIADSKLAALVDFTVAMVRTRGLPTSVEVEAFRAAGYHEQNMLAVVAAIGVKVMSNYTNHLFDNPVDDSFAAYSWTAADSAAA